MTIKRSVLSKQQIKERIKNLVAIIQTKFDISYEEIENLIKNNKDLIHVDQSEFVPCLQHLQSAYGLKDFQINKILYICLI